MVKGFNAIVTTRWNCLTLKQNKTRTTGTSEELLHRFGPNLLRHAYYQVAKKVV